jgi:hypothetical protein
LARQTRFSFLVCEQDLGAKSGGYFSRAPKQQMMNPLQQRFPEDALPQLDFFILGAARCGTTSLYAALRQHPQLFLPTEKEPSYFSKGFQVVKSREAYLDLYARAGKGQLRGDASHVYFSNPSSAAMLEALYPEARFILTVRDPADRAYSLYRFMKGHGLEALPTFEAALTAEAGRKAHYLATGASPHYIYNFLYRESGLYGAQLARYRERFPAAQFHILSLSQLRESPAESLREIFRFLKVDASDAISLPALNAAPRVGQQSSWWQFARRRGAPPLAPDTRTKLRTYFAPDQALFRELMGVSFSSTNAHYHL